MISSTGSRGQTLNRDDIIISHIPLIKKHLYKIRGIELREEVESHLTEVLIQQVDTRDMQYAYEQWRNRLTKRLSGGVIDYLRSNWEELNVVQLDDGYPISRDTDTPEHMAEQMEDAPPVRREGITKGMPPKLTQEQAEEIAQSTLSTKALMKQYDVCNVVVWKIRTGKYVYN